MTISKTKKFGAILALAMAIAAPVMAAAPASAEPVRSDYVRVVDGPRHAMPVRYEHRGEYGYRDMNWRELRFHRHNVVERHQTAHDHFGR